MEKAVRKWRSRWETALLEIVVFHEISIKPRYGRELIITAREKVSNDVKVPTVYAILNRAKTESLLADFSKIEKDSETRGTSRRYYRLTTTGKEFLNQILGPLRRSVDILKEIDVQIALEGEIN